MCFSAKAIIIKLAYRYGVDAITLLALRMLFSLPLFVLLAWWASRESLTPVSGRDAYVISVLGLVGYYLASYFDFLGLQYITAGLARLVLFLYPTFVLLFSAVLFQRPVTRRDVLALALSYLGIVLVFVNDLRTQPGNVVLGSFWVLLSALFYAAYLLGSGRLVTRVGSNRFSAYAGIAASVGVIVHFLVTSHAALLFKQAAAVYGLAFLMASLATVLPIALTAEGIRRIGSSHASILGAVGPVTTIILGFMFLGEPITAIQVAGAALVMGGVLAIALHKGPSR